MKKEIQEFITLLLVPELEAVALLNPIVGLVCEKCVLPEERRYNVIMAVEEVFSYCVKMLNAQEICSHVRILFCRDSRALHVVMEYEGPVGELERNLMPGVRKEIKRNTFEAMGLYLARESVDRLEFSIAYGGKNRFTMSKRFVEKE